MVFKDHIPLSPTKQPKSPSKPANSDLTSLVHPIHKGFTHESIQEDMDEAFETIPGKANE